MQIQTTQNSQEQVLKAITALQKKLAQDLKRKRYYGVDRSIRTIQKTYHLMVRI
ncbi:MAG: hypothetical protein JNK65_08620 [Deltaproteobacteria bacterium]|nr:hypothetical protein [Deltaproteobacteria bacterium]